LIFGEYYDQKIINLPKGLLKLTIPQNYPHKINKSNILKIIYC